MEVKSHIKGRAKQEDIPKYRQTVQSKKKKIVAKFSRIMWMLSRQESHQKNSQVWRTALKVVL